MNPENLRFFAVLFVLAFGLSIGSFLNVVIWRLPRKQSLVKPRSRCPGCGNAIAGYDNIPVISYLILGGQCRHCKTSISIRYPLIELATGLLAVACFYRFGPQDLLADGASTALWAFFGYFLFCALLMAITFIDIPFQIIPDSLSLPFIPLGILLAFLAGSTRGAWYDAAWFNNIMGAVVGFSIIALIVYGYYFLTKREGMGMGDAKLMALIGAFLGWQCIPFVLFAGSVQGLAIALIGIFSGRIKKAPPLPDPEEWVDGVPPVVTEEVALRHAAIPFGPFLSLAALEFLFFGEWFYKALLHLHG